MIQWHRLVGTALKDCFYKTTYKVEAEKDLSEQQQFLDILIVRRKKGNYPEPKELPDGLDNLANHNLITFKSFRESLLKWSMQELTGHYTTYRKLVSERKKLLPEQNFNLYAITARKPSWLEKGKHEYKELQQGIYHVSGYGLAAKIIVTKELPRTKHNAIWFMFTGVKESIKFGTKNYKIHNPQLGSTLYNTLHEYYTEEKIMSYSIEDFNHDYLKRNINHLTTNERLKGLSSDERLKGLSSDERLKGLASEDRLKGLSKEYIQNYLKNL